MRRVLALSSCSLALFLVAGAFSPTGSLAWAGDPPTSERVGPPSDDATGVVPRDDGREVGSPRGDFTGMLDPTACAGRTVWRLAGPNDRICVQPHAHQRVARENAEGPSHVDPNGGAYGPETCLPGFVWRDAFPGDHVCVTPDSRRLASWENESDKIAH